MHGCRGTGAVRTIVEHCIVLVRPLRRGCPFVVHSPPPPGPAAAHYDACMSSTTASPPSAATPPQRAAVASLLAITLIWSANWIVMKLAMGYCGPFDFSAFRYVGSTVVLFLVLLARGESMAPPPLGPTLAVGLTQTTGFTALAQWALVRGGAGQTALLVYTMPFWGLLLAWLFLHERLRGAQWISVGLAVLGMLLILRPWGLHADLRNGLLAVCSGLSWAAGTVLSKRLFLRYGAGLSALRMTAWQMLLGGAGLCLLAVLVPQRPVDWSAGLVAAVAFNVLLAGGLAWTLWAFVVQRLPAGIAGLSSLAIPTTGVLMAWAWLGERPGGAEIAGVAVIAAALLLLLRASTR